jgi:hypothetical protein
MAACAGIGHYVKQINERKVSMDALKDAPVLELRPIGTIHPPFRSPRALHFNLREQVEQKELSGSMSHTALLCATWKALRLFFIEDKDWVQP